MATSVAESSEFTRVSFRPGRSAARLVVPGAILLLLLVLMVVARRDALGSPALLNADEAELMGDARRALLNFVPYVTYTTPTYLYLWPVFLGLLGKLGMPLTLVSAHVLSGLSYVWMAFACWYALSTRLSAWLAALFVIPTALVMFVGPNDFLSLGTELLPAVVLIVGAAVVCWPQGPITRRRLAIATFLAGSSVWAKPQILPLACAFVASAVLLTMLDDTDSRPVARILLERSAVATAFFLIPTLISLGLMLAAGTLGTWWQEPMRWTFGYVLHRSPANNGLSPSLPNRIRAIAETIRAFDAAYLFSVPGLAAIVYGERRRRHWLAGVIWLAPLIGGVVTFLFSFPLFDHYANLLFASTIVSGMVAAAAAGAPRQRTPAGGTPPWLLPAAAGALALLTLKLALPLLWSPFVYAPFPVPRDTAALHALCPAQSRVLVWGWAAELYGDYDWVPASRYVDTTWQVLASGNKAYYRSQLLRELQAAPPACIVESGKAFFSNNYFAPLAADIPAAGELLASCYQQPRPAPDLDATVYVRLVGCHSGESGRQLSQGFPEPTPRSLAAKQSSGLASA